MSEVNRLAAVMDEDLGVAFGDVVGVEVGNGEVVDLLEALEFAYRRDFDPGAG